MTICGITHALTQSLNHSHTHTHTQSICQSVFPLPGISHVALHIVMGQKQQEQATKLSEHSWFTGSGHELCRGAHIHAHII